MITTKISRVAHLVELCVEHGIKRIVLSPGSRNAPLVIAFNSHPEIEVFLIHDERSAAFFALGMAENSGVPVAIACTSGSAPINYAPAVSEAYYRNIPLFVLTADRPSRLIDQGDGQTIRQVNLYQNFIKAEFQLPESDDSNAIVESDKVVNQAINALKSAPKGPVHINIPLEEPLYEKKELQSTPLFVPIVEEDKELTLTEKEHIASVWSTAEKKLILIGQHPPKELPKVWLQSIVDDPSVAIVTENTANFQDFFSVSHCIDRSLATITEEELERFTPDLLVSIGGAIISKKIKAFFRKNKPKHNWRVGEFFFEEDTFQSLSQSFKVTPKTFFHYLTTEIDCAPLSNFGSLWKQKDFLAQEIHKKYVSNLPFSDFKAFDLILDTLPEHVNLHMANSSVVRYCQLFDPIQSVSYFSNRGVSGIDGSTSTAAGIAKDSPNRLNVLITGDISFFYDSNGLWNQYLGSNLRIILINNGGGGIFKIIDGPKQSEHADLFVAPFEAKAKSICEAFDVGYMNVSSNEELENSFEKFYNYGETNKPVLLEINTSLVDNESLLKEYFKQIKSSFVN